MYLMLFEYEIIFFYSESVLRMDTHIFVLLLLLHIILIEGAEQRGGEQSAEGSGLILLHKTLSESGRPPGYGRRQGVEEPARDKPYESQGESKNTQKERKESTNQ